MEHTPLWTRLKRCAFTESTYFTINRPEYIKLVVYQLSVNIMTLQRVLYPSSLSGSTQNSLHHSSLPSHIAYSERKDKTVGRFITLKAQSGDHSPTLPSGYPCGFLCASHFNVPACSVQRPHLKSSSSLHIGCLRYVSSVIRSNWVYQLSVYVRVS